MNHHHHCLIRALIAEVRRLREQNEELRRENEGLLDALDWAEESAISAERRWEARMAEARRYANEERLRAEEAEARARQERRAREEAEIAAAWQRQRQGYW